VGATDPVSSSPESDRWFTEHVLPHEPALRAWLRGRFPSLTDVDDIVQEAYARVLRVHLHTPIEAPKAFLFTTARNLVLDVFRHGKVTGADRITEFDELSVLEEEPGVSETVSRHQELELLSQAIKALPERCRQVLTLRKIYGLSQKQIAAELGISENTVEAQVGNGVRRCAEFLARHGLP
jgi:RNA polymerase sigma factor (sigma-70 family)